jgi:hypothetical protein
VESKQSISPAVAIAATGMFLGVIATLLVSTMARLDDKAEKADTGDRWTGKMQEIQHECEKGKEALRQERETLRDESSEWKMKYYDAEAEVKMLKMFNEKLEADTRTRDILEIKQSIKKDTVK